MTATSSVRPSTAIADPNNPGNVLVPNAQNAEAVTKSDSTVFSPPTIGLWVGGTGDVAVRMYGSQTSVTFTAVPDGTMLPIQCDQVLDTGTDATDIVRLW
jgi:hypothetical protein